jgi:hypothetical protein
VPGTFDKPLYGAHAVCAAAAIALAVLIGCLAGPPAASAEPPETRYVYASGEIVPLPAAIPHEEGDMVDRRIVPDLRWLAQRFPIYVTDGYSGPLPSGEHVGCHGCHVKHSDHYNGLAVDIVPLNASGRGCDASWRGITRLAHWAEPVQNRPRAPFRWVGYDGDAGHGCGNHLHLSWEHAAAPMFELAEWVEVFPAGNVGVTREPKRQPRGGVSVVQSGGVSPRGD